MKPTWRSFHVNSQVCSAQAVFLFKKITRERTERNKRERREQQDGQPGTKETERVNRNERRDNRQTCLGSFVSVLEQHFRKKQVLARKSNRPCQNCIMQIEDKCRVSERLMTLWPASDQYLFDVSIGLVFAEHGLRCALSRKTETLSLREARMPCDLRAMGQFTPVCLFLWASVHVKRGIMEHLVGSRRNVSCMSTERGE